MGRATPWLGFVKLAIVGIWGQSPLVMGLVAVETERDRSQRDGLGRMHIRQCMRHPLAGDRCWR